VSPWKNKKNNGKYFHMKPELQSNNWTIQENKIKEIKKARTEREKKRKRLWKWKIWRKEIVLKLLQII
jgi:hypothetical protein